MPNAQTTGESHVLANVTCVALGGRGLLITGAPGIGKSALALALIDRGAELVGDDGVTLTPLAGRIIASPPPHIAGLVEVRGVGLVTMPTTSAPLALALHLTEGAPRLPPEPLANIGLLGIAVPYIGLWPEGHALPLRAEWALATHGLS